MVYDLLQPYPLVLLATAGFSAALAAYVAGFRRRRASRWLVVILVAASIWSLADGLRIAAPTAAEVLFWNQVTYVGAGLIVPATLFFVARFTNRSEWLRPRRAYPVGAISAVMVVLVFTNQWHGLWRPDETVTPGTAPPVLVDELGIVHVAWAVYVLLLVIPLLYVMLARDLRASTGSRLHRQQIGLIMLGIGGPVITSTAYVLDLTAVDLTPMGFTVFGLALTLGISRYRMLDIVPIARDAVVEQVGSGVLVLDQRDRIVDANPEALAIVDESADAVIGASVADVFGDVDAVRETLASVTDEPTTVAVDVAGETRHYQADVSEVRDAGGVRLGRVVIFSDVTGAVRRQEQLEAKTAALERKNQQLDEFASVLSHDLRNPLSIASLRLEQVETDDEAAIESARDALDRIDRMSEQLLTLARAGSEVETTASVDLAEVATRAWQAVQGEHDGECDLHVAEPGTVEGAPQLVVELFENCFRNALEHNDGDVTVTVAALPAAEGPGFVVADDGAGFDGVDRERLFEHGYTTDAGGTGYGLAIVEDIVEAHDWAITASESDDGGARFAIRTTG